MRIFKMIVLLIGVVFVSTGAPNAATNDASIENFMVLSEQLENAVDARNFQKAREIVDELLPLMKEDIKNSKKTLSSLKKEENPKITEKEYEKLYDRKVVLYDSVKHLIELSPAALRVKSALIVSEVDEFIKLMNNSSLDS